MSSFYCSQGHVNSAGSRFCSICGEKLGQGVTQGLVLGKRYRILRQLGHGGFGRTYLAEDINRFNEPCVLKEFAPQAQGTYALQKAEELFEREAGILYKLQHPQIPRFRELFRASIEGRDYLFLVQDYVDGQGYHQLLEARKRQGFCFSDYEVTQLLLQLLPVLSYLHRLGVIHRDISPDNMILRNRDQIPVLIDFGGVKQIAAAATQYVQPGQVAYSSPTRLGKVGYAPAEQMQQGFVYPHSDLYALGVTALVLLTGKEPSVLLDSSQPLHPWQQQLSFSPVLTTVLSRMTAPRPGDRYQSAEEVLQVLSGAASVNEPPTQPPPSASQQTVPPLSPTFPHTQPMPAVAAAIASTPGGTVSPKAHKGQWIGGILVLLLLAGGAAGGWWTRDLWRPLLPDGPQAVEPGTDTSSNFPPDEQSRKAALRERRAALGVDYQFLINLTNATFYERNPDQEGRTLTDGTEDAEWRNRWDAIADEWLDIFDQHLSADSRRRLGSFEKADRDRWKREVNQLHVSSRALNDLTDARFFTLFPQQREQEFLDQPIGQVWQAIAADTVVAMQNGTVLERVRFEPGDYTQQAIGTLEPGEGQVYIANLSEGQILRLNLQAPDQATQLSVYLPRPTQETPFLVEDSERRSWSGRLPQSGFYEVVLTAQGTAPIDYQLNWSVDNVTSTPIEPEEPEEPEAKN